MVNCLPTSFVSGPRPGPRHRQMLSADLQSNKVNALWAEKARGAGWWGRPKNRRRGRRRRGECGEDGGKDVKQPQLYVVQFDDM